MPNWEPLASGNYSSWREQLDNEVARYCSSNAAFKDGVSLFGSSVARNFFSHFSSESGLSSLTRAVEDSSISSYMNSKPGIIVFLVIALLVLIGSIILTFSLMQCFRAKLGKVNRSCRDRPRVPPKALPRSVLYSTIALGSLAFLLLIGLGIGSFVYAGYTSQGMDAVSCDVWQSLRGHYFGATDLEAPPETATDWKGTYPQEQAMATLRDLVNPLPADGKQCIMCRAVEKKFSGPGGLVEAVSNSRDTVMQSAFVFSLLSSSMGGLLSPLNLKFAALNVEGFIKFHALASSINFYYARGLPLLLEQYADQLDKTTDDGIKLFRDTIDEHLGPDSRLLKQSYGAATTSITSLKDVDHVVAKGTQTWASQLPGLYGAIRALVAFGSLMGIFALLLPAVGIWLGVVSFKAMKQQNEVPPQQTVRVTGGLYAAFMVYGGLTLVLSAVFYMAAHIGSDGCGFIDAAIYRDGSWDILPKHLWHDTPSQTTDMKAVLDTCIKETGDGDIASSLGLRMLLDTLSQDVEVASKKIVETLNYKLDLDFKSQKTNALSALTKNAPYLLAQYPVQFGLADSTTPKPKLASPKLKEGFFLIRSEPREGPIPVACLANVMPTGLRPVAELGVSFVTECVKHIATVTSGPVAAMEELNRLAAEAAQNDTTITITSFCPNYLAAEKLCNAGKGVYMIKGRNDEGIWVDNPFANADIQKIIRYYHNIENEEAVGMSVHILLSFLAYDTAYSSTIGDNTLNVVNLEPIVKRITGIFDDFDWASFPKTVPAHLILSRIVNIPECNANLPSCSFQTLMKHYVTSADAASKSLLHGFSLANSRIEDFVYNVTLASFKNQMEASMHSLQHFNCQFLGSSIYEGVRAGVCRVLMPSIASLGLIGILIWIAACLASFSVWRIYHYFHNVTTFADIRDPKLSNLTATASDGLKAGEPKK